MGELSVGTGVESIIMPVGKCALCLETRELRDSHFLPAGFYRIMREGAPNENPVLVNKTSAFMSSAQVKAYLLCGECEQRFSQGGEDWVLKNCWRSPTEFQLHSMLMAATPLVDEEGFRSFEGARIRGVDTDKLAYFGLSIFWRAAVHTWTVGREKDQRICLGPYQEKLRLYLIGKTGIPDGIVQLVTLSTALDDMHNRVSAMPWLFERKPQYRSYKFIVTGFTFHMFVGMMIDKPIRRICSARRGFLYMSEQRDADLLKTMAIMANRAEKRGKLAKPQPV
jgi:hypothetical protein